MPSNKASVSERPYAGFGMEQFRAIRLHRERSAPTPHEPVVAPQKVAIYARVSSAEHRANLERKVERRSHYCNAAENDKEDLIADLVAMVYAFTARLSGQRRAKRKTARIVQELQANGDE